MEDLIIIGGGPSGLAAAIYSARYKLKTLVLARELGGLIMESWKVENYPGLEPVSGADLIKKFSEQTKKFGAVIKEEDVEDISKEKSGFKITTSKGKYESKAVILASGTERKKLNAKNAEKFTGKGVAYCATCDAPLFRDKDVVVAGGGDSAVMAALLLTEYASKVYIIYRGEALSAEPYKIELAKKNKKITVMCCTDIKEIQGKNFVESVLLDNGKQLKAEGVFIEIGSTPGAAIAKKLGVKMDKEGYIITDSAQATNIKGVYAAGDTTTNSDKFRQVVTAAAEGAIAAHSIYEYLKSEK